jgi:hypothetical protein
MQFKFAAQAALAVMLVAPAPLHSGPLDTIRITIKGGNLAAPIEITGAQEVRRFRVGVGPGHYRVLADGTHIPIEPTKGFIVDWPKGIAEPPRGSPIYEVSFETTHTGRSIYVIRYVIDPSTKAGYVYIPGKEDAAYPDNVYIMIRGIEGNWFHAWSEWENLAHPLIARARTVQ